MPRAASLKADYMRKAELSKAISKFRGNSIGVVRMLKDPSVKCELEESLKPLPLSPRAAEM